MAVEVGGLQSCLVVVDWGCCGLALADCAFLLHFKGGNPIFLGRPRGSTFTDPFLGCDVVGPRGLKGPGTQCVIYLCLNSPLYNEKNNISLLPWLS